MSLKYEATRRMAAIEFELRIYASDGTTRIATLRTGEGGDEVVVDSPGGTIEFTLAAVPLASGAYYLGALVRDLVTSKTLAWWDGETRLHVQDGPRGGGQQQIPHTWRHIHADAGERALAASVRISPPG